MKNLESALGSLVYALTDENYDESLNRYRFLFQLGKTYSLIPSNLVFDTIWKYKDNISCRDDFTYPTSSLILRFANDAESDDCLASYSAGLRSRFCASILREFFDFCMRDIKHDRYADASALVDANLIAHGVNLGYIEESTIRDHILQSLIPYPGARLSGAQTEALLVLFTIAGATFTTYVDHTVVDRCFGLFKECPDPSRNRGPLIQKLVKLRAGGWDGLPPPPLFTLVKPELPGMRREDSSATPVPTSLGLPNMDSETQPPQFPLESITVPENETRSGSPVTLSPSISIATLSDFSFSGTEPPADAALTDPTPTGPTPTGPPIEPAPTDPFVESAHVEPTCVEPTSVTPHSTFYLEDGNLEVLCENSLFRVHTSVLSFHSMVLRQTFTQANLATAESPNACPRILSDDTAADFAILLKVIYLPGFPERNKVPDFSTFSSLLRVTKRYDLSTVRLQLLEVIHDAYPESFEGVTPTKTLGEKVFGGRTPHPNEVLNLFTQQGITSALPMAYYMAVRRGFKSLMDRSLSRGATLSSEILQSAAKGLMAVRELELNETYCLILGQNPPHPCSSLNCPSRKTTGPRVSEAHKKVIDRITGSSQAELGTKVLQVLSLSEVFESNPDEFCESCIRGWENGHVEVRKKAWDMLSRAFGLNG